MLVALNAELTLGRAAVCRLAAELDAWFPYPRRRLKALASGLDLPLPALDSALGLMPSAAERAGNERRRAAALGAHIITRFDEAYPDALRELSLPPPVLYVWGELPEAPGIAIVGSRRPDAYGREAAAFFAHHLARAGVVVVSGFAHGVDAAAHRAALEAPEGVTVAILGCGLDVPYPSGQQDLTRRIIQGRGAVVSELPMGALPAKQNFPVRNRIIAALARATLVVQATARSGSLITARHALDLGRELFALPGRIFDETSLGPNALLRDGCRPALHPADLIQEALGRRVDAAAAADASGEGQRQSPPPPLPASGARLWELLPAGRARAAEEIAAELGSPVQEILGGLLELELGGWVERLPGPAYRRRRA
jgi:DNA processing protein